MLKEKLDAAVVEIAKDVVFDRKLCAFWNYFVCTCELGVGNTHTRAR